MTTSLETLSLDALEGPLVRRGPLLLVIADGFGSAEAGPSNAISEAETPRLDSLMASEMATTLLAHGPAVGLPSDGDMGNSEVGHNALGAGRVFAQGAKLVNRAIADGSMFEGTAWRSVVASGRGQTLHFVGLHSDGNVHSHTSHLYEMLRRAAEEGVKSCALHLLHDGRDVAMRSALTYIQATEEVLSEINAAHGTDFRIASGGGRMTITMDRYGADWPMVERGYNAHAHGIGRPFSSARQAVETMYAESDLGDQYLDEFVVTFDDGIPVGAMSDGDGVILFNFRGDRSIEISRAFEDHQFPNFDRGQNPQVNFVGLLQYDGDAFVPKHYLVEPPAIDRTISEFLCTEGVRSFAISETQKYGHVTYFWNGNRSGHVDESLETYIEIPSDNVEFNKTPAMKVREITDRTIELLRSGDFDWGRLNFPSADMVGHTGDLNATIEAVRVLEDCMGQLLDVIEEVGGVLVFTADHGNADIMYTEKDGVKTPLTSHTLSPVPFAIFDPTNDGVYDLARFEGAGLSNVAATLMNLLGFEAPPDYDQSLITVAPQPV